MADYTAEIALAHELLDEFGMPMIFVAQEEGTYDPVTNTRPTIETRTPVMGVRTAPTVDEVQSGLFAVGSTDRLEFGGHRWNITAIKTVAPAEEILLYKFQVRDAGAIK